MKQITLLLLGLWVAACNMRAENVARQESAQPIISSATNTPAPTQNSGSRASLTTTSTQNNIAPQSGNSNVSDNTSNTQANASTNLASNAYWVTLPPPYPACSVSPTGNYTVYIRKSAASSAEVVGVLDKASWVNVSRLMNGWYQVSYPGTPVDGLWILGDPVTLTPPCTCGPDCGTLVATPYGPLPAATFLPTNYVVDLPAPFLACSVTAYSDYTVNIRNGPSQNSTIIGTLAVASWVKVSQMINGWYQIDHPNTPVHQMWISNNPVFLVQPCTCTPICEAGVVEPVEGICTVSSSRNETIFAGPGNWHGTYGEVAANVPLVLKAISTNGWYKVEFLTTTSAEGWIPSNQAIQTGNCVGLSTEQGIPPTSTCTATNTSGVAQWIYLTTNTNDPIARFQPNINMPALARNGNWYQVYIEAFSSAGWVDASFITLSGQCANLPQK